MIETIEDRAATWPTHVLIEFIRARYHETHRRALPELIALARKVESDHANDLNAPHGLTPSLETLFAALVDHLHEEIVFLGAAKKSGRPAEALALFRRDHLCLEAELNKIAAITHGFRLPRYSDDAWSRLYAGLRKLVDDLEEQMYLENEVLFPRLETAA